MSDNDDADSHGGDCDAITSPSETVHLNQVTIQFQEKENLGLVLCLDAGSFNS